MRVGILGVALSASATGWSSATASAADRCTTADTLLLRAICDIEMVQNTYGEVRDAYTAALARLSPEGRTYLKQDQDVWEARTKAACIDHPEITASHHDDNYVMSVVPLEYYTSDGDGVAAASVNSVNFCLFEALAERKAHLASQPAPLGDFLWQSVSLGHDTYCDSKPEARDNRLSFERTAMRIDAPANAATRSWNERHGPRSLPAEEESHDVCAHDGRVVRESYASFAQGDFVFEVSRHSVLYYDKVHDYVWGRPTYGRQTEKVSFELVSSGKRLGPADFFTAGSGWESFIGKRAYAEYLSDVKEAGRAPMRSEADFIAGVQDVNHWLVFADGLAYGFSPTDLDDYGSNTIFSWKELRPYFGDDLPFQPDFK
jgi:hypothetical protein